MKTPVGFTITTSMNEVQREEIRHFMREAYRLSQYSSDLDTQNGAVLVASGKIVAVGVNEIVKGVKRLPERIRRPLKYTFTVHAEEAAVLHAARIGKATSGLTLVCPYAACTGCATSIITAGIVSVIRHKQCMDRMPERWRESVQTADMMFQEAGVTVLDFDDEAIGECSQLFDGEVWHP